MATINELSVKAFNKELAEMLEAFAKKHGLKKGAQRIVYARDGSTMKMTVDFGDTTSTGDANPKFFRNLARHGFAYGLTTKMMDTEFPLGRLGKVKLVGMSSPKFAIVQTADKRLFKYDPQVVANMLKATVALKG